MPLCRQDRYSRVISQKEIMAQVLALPKAQRRRLAQRLWDSVKPEWGAEGLTPAQVKELNRRIDDLDRNPGAGEPWEVVERRLLRKYGYASLSGRGRKKTSTKSSRGMKRGKSA